MKDPRHRSKLALVTVLALVHPAIAEDSLPLLAEDRATRLRAQLALVRSGAKARQLVPRLVKAMRGGDARAGWALACIGEPAIPALAAEIDQKHGYLTAAWGPLVSLGKQAVPAAVEMLGNEEWGARYQALMLIQRLAPFAESAVPAVRDVMANDPRFREMAAGVLTSITDDAGDVIAALAGCTLDADLGGEIRTLARLGPRFRTALPPLREALDEETEFRVELLAAIWEIERDAEFVVPKLAELVAKADDETSAKAARILTRIGPGASAAVELILARIANSEGKTVRTACALAAHEIRIPASQLDSVQELSRAEDVHLRRIGLSLLGAVEPPPETNVQFWIEALDDSEATIREAAGWSLSDHGETSPAIVAALCKAGRDEVPEVAMVAVRALGERRELAAIPTLREIVKTSKTWLPWHAAYVLGTMGEDAAASIPDLIAALESEDDALSRAAATALGCMGDAGRKALPQLRAGRRSEDVHFAVACTGAVWRLGGDVDEAVELLRTPVRGRGPSVLAFDLLAEMGPAARAALPDIECWLRTAEPYLDGGGGVRPRAAYAHWKIAGDPTRAVECLVRDCEIDFEHGSLLNPSALEDLARMGPAARRVLPVLRRLARDPKLSWWVWPDLRDAIHKIEGRK